MCNAGIPPGRTEGRGGLQKSYSVHFHDFIYLPKTKGRRVLSPSFTLANYGYWKIKLYPCENDKAKDDSVSVFLQNCGRDAVSLHRFSLAVRTVDGAVSIERTSSNTLTVRPFEKIGWRNFMTHEKCISTLNKGTLTIEVRAVRQARSQDTFTQNILSSFLDKETADILFDVQGTHLHAHKVVLKSCAKDSTLAVLCKNYSAFNPIRVTHVKPQIFRKMLYLVYGGTLSTSDWKVYSKDLVDVANRFGVTNVKLIAKTFYAENIEITVNNVAELLLYSINKDCFILKEKVMKFIKLNTQEVIESDSFEAIFESRAVTKEILSMIVQKGTVQEEDFAELSIRKLRLKASELIDHLRCSLQSRQA